MRQLITPDPNIPCQPGWCLAYVNEAFGVKKVFGSATDAWFGSATQHRDRNFPPGVWVPVWYGLDTTPLGHVVLLAPNGNVYSTSDLTNTPHVHPDLADLEAYYAYYGMTLTYRGWTEDVEGTPVIGGDGLAAMGGIITPIQEEEDMGYVDGISDEAAAKIAGHLWNFDYQTPDGRAAKPLWLLQSIDAIIRETIEKTAAATARVILASEVPNVLTGGKTSLGLETSWAAYNVQALKDDVKPSGLSEEEFSTILQQGIDKAVSGLSITLTASKEN